MRMELLFRAMKDTIIFTQESVLSSLADLTLNILTSFCVKFDDPYSVATLLLHVIFGPGLGVLIVIVCCCYQLRVLKIQLL